MVPVVYCRFSRREDVEEHEAQDQDDNQDGDAGFCSVIALYVSAYCESFSVIWATSLGRRLRRHGCYVRLSCIEAAGLNQDGGADGPLGVRSGTPLLDGVWCLGLGVPHG